MIKTLAIRGVALARRSRLAEDEQGTVAVIFALVALPLLAVLSLAIDYGRATHVQTTLQNAADAAAGAAIRLAGAETDVIRDSFAANFRANLPADLKETPFELSIDKDNGTVAAKVETRVATSLTGIVGITALDVKVETTQRFARIGGGSGQGGGGDAASSPPGASAPPSGLSQAPTQQALSRDAERRLREMGYDMNNPELRRRAAEAEARVRELMAQHPGLFRQR